MATTTCGRVVRLGMAMLLAVLVLCGVWCAPRALADGGIGLAGTGREATADATDPQASYATDVAISIVVDVSGSMDDASALGGMTKLDSAKRQASAFVNGSIRDERGEDGLSTVVGVCSFTDVAQVECDLSGDASRISDALYALVPKSTTNLHAGLQLGITQLEDHPGAKIMLLLSDGLANEGPGESAIVDLAHEAKDKGIVVYTIGYGASSELDESLLREIASITGGTYAHEDPSDISSAAVGLFAAMMEARLQQTHDVLVSQTGTVRQDDTVEVGSFAVTGSGTLTCYLYWPGSAIDIELTDPEGTKVTQGYAGYMLDTTTIPSVATVQAAKLGRWTMSVFGREVSMDAEPYYAVAAFKQVATSLPSGGGGAPNNGFGLLFLLIVVAVGSVLGLYAYTLRRR